MYDHCTVQTEGHVLVVTIDRPEVMNALHFAANFELAQIFDRFDADPDLWVAILTGSGDRAFCAGLDLKSLDPDKELPKDPPSGFGGLTHRFGSTKPIIAAVNGVAAGGGFEIALACDLIIASDTAFFTLPEARVGLVPMAGGIHRLTRQIGLKLGMGMLLTGRRVNADEALALGFVNEVVPGAELMPAAHRWAAEIQKCAPLSVRASKACVMEGMQHGCVQAAMTAHYDAIDEMLQSADLHEGLHAFQEKRRPEWKGR